MMGLQICLEGVTKKNHNLNLYVSECDSNMNGFFKL